jgi:hypothetical protein
MKKALTILAGALIVPLLSSQAWADGTNAAQSVNAVGVVKYEIPAGELICVALPLNPLETSNTNQCWVWGETSFAQQLSNGSVVFFWKGEKWKDYKKDIEDGTWGRAARTNVLAAGEAFFVRGAQTQTISLLGELPTEDTIPYSLSGGGNLNVRGVSPYPVSGTFGTSSLASNLPNGSVVFFWTGGKWKDYKKDIEDGTWPRGARTNQYAVGQGIFIRVAGDGVDNLANDRPFDWDD